MAKTSGQACVLSIRIQSHIVFFYIIIIIVRTFNVTPSHLYVVVEATYSERCTLEDLFYYYDYIIIAIILITTTLISIIIIITITCCRTN